jgi:uncharacterized protein (TIGR03663 family)
MNKTAFRGLFLLVLAGTLLLRLPRLGLRPMHHDEANQAVKFGTLLEKGEYRYDKTEHHGPSLYYLTLPVAWAFSKQTLASLDETTLRLVPAIFGAGIILLLLFFGDGMGRPAVLFSGLLAALSPAMTYFSRFYIQETLFVFFIVGFLGSLWRLAEHPSTGRALASGFFAGMMYATKETSIIIFAAVGGAIVLTIIFRKKTISGRLPLPKIRMIHILWGLAAAAVTAFIFFSSFFKNPKGILDSMIAFKGYFEKGGSAGFHAPPLLYYLTLLAYSKSGAGPAWSEALILGLAIVGGAAAFQKKDRRLLKANAGRAEKPFSSATSAENFFPKFIFFFTVLATAAFSIIPYKTPWNLLPFYIGIILLAGMGAAFIFQSLRKDYLKVIAGLLLAAGLFHLGWQSCRANFQFYADRRNPYAYAETSPDFLQLAKRIDRLAALHPEGRHMLIKVVCGLHQTWPLPWYLRSFDRVGYWQDWPTAGGFERVPLIIADEDQAENLGPLLQDKYQAEYYGLRPDVLLVLFIDRGFWEKYLLDGKK